MDSNWPSPRDAQTTRRSHALRRPSASTLSAHDPPCRSIRRAVTAFREALASTTQLPRRAALAAGESSMSQYPKTRAPGLCEVAAEARRRAAHRPSNDSDHDRTPPSTP